MEHKYDQLQKAFFSLLNLLDHADLALADEKLKPPQRIAHATVWIKARFELLRDLGYEIEFQPCASREEADRKVEELRQQYELPGDCVATPSKEVH